MYIKTTYGPLIDTVLYDMILMRANPLLGQVEGGLALENLDFFEHQKHNVPTGPYKSLVHNCYNGKVWHGSRWTKMGWIRCDSVYHHSEFLYNIWKKTKKYQVQGIRRIKIKAKNKVKIDSFCEPEI